MNEQDYLTDNKEIYNIPTVSKINGKNIEVIDKSTNSTNFKVNKITNIDKSTHSKVSEMENLINVTPIINGKYDDINKNNSNKIFNQKINFKVDLIDQK